MRLSLFKISSVAYKRNVLQSSDLYSNNQCRKSFVLFIQMYFCKRNTSDLLTSDLITFDVQLTVK